MADAVSAEARRATAQSPRVLIGVFILRIGFADVVGVVSTGTTLMMPESLDFASLTNVWFLTVAFDQRRSVKRRRVPSDILPLDDGTLVGFDMAVGEPQVDGAQLVSDGMSIHRHVRVRLVGSRAAIVADHRLRDGDFISGM